MASQLSSWTPLSADEQYRHVDAIIVSYWGRRGIDSVAGEDSPYRNHSVIAAARRTFMLEDHACEGIGFSGRLVELFRESGYSLWRVPDENSGHPLAELCSPSNPDPTAREDENPLWLPCATRCSIVRRRFRDSVELHFRLQHREIQGFDGAAYLTLAWSLGSLNRTGCEGMGGGGCEEVAKHCPGPDSSGIDFVQQMLTDTHPNIKLAGDVLEIDPEARLMPEPVPADVEAPQTCWQQVVSCLRGIWEGICAALAAVCACLTCCFRSEEAEREI